MAEVFRDEVDEAAQAAHDADRDELKSRFEKAQKHSAEADQVAKNLGNKTRGA